MSSSLDSHLVGNPISHLPAPCNLNVNMPSVGMLQVGVQDVVVSLPSQASLLTVSLNQWGRG